MRGSRGLNDAEIARVLLSFRGRNKKRDRCLFVVGILTGFRINELLSIRVRDVIDERGRVKDFVTVARQHMKRKKASRSVPLLPEARREIRELLHGRIGAGDQFLFGTSQGKMTIQRAWQILVGVFDLAGLSGRLSTHSMRKTFARKARIACNGDLYLLRDMMGHESINSTVAYLQNSEDRIVESFRAISLTSNPSQQSAGFITDKPKSDLPMVKVNG